MLRHSCQHCKPSLKSFLSLPPHRTAPHGNMAGTSTALQALLQGQRADATHCTAGVGAGRGKDDIVWFLARSCHRPPTAPPRTSGPPAKAASTAATARTAHTTASKDPAAKPRRPALQCRVAGNGLLPGEARQLTLHMPAQPLATLRFLQPVLIAVASRCCASKLSKVSCGCKAGRCPYAPEPSGGLARSCSKCPHLSAHSSFRAMRHQGRDQPVLCRRDISRHSLRSAATNSWVVTVRAMRRWASLLPNLESSYRMLLDVADVTVRWRCGTPSVPC